MEIHLENISKRFNRSWIFRDVNYTFATGQRYAILGGNGSGKSTLLQIISGFLTPTKGRIWFQQESKTIQPDGFYHYISMATPYMELPEELSLQELIRFHGRFKKPLLDYNAFMERIELAREKDKEIKNFSSGMRQRLKIGLAVLFASDVVLLDEPTTHLDARATQWYRELVQEHTKERCLIISSNQPVEYDFCTHLLQVEEYKR